MRTFTKAQDLKAATIAEGALVGRLDDFQFDLESGEIYGWRVKAGMFGKTGGVPAAALVQLGRDLALLRGEGAIEWSGGRASAEGRAWASAYSKKRVVTRRGAELGEVVDYVVEVDPPRVRALLLDGGHVVPLGPRVALGKDAVVLDDASVALAVADHAVESAGWWAVVRGLLEGAPVG